VAPLADAAPKAALTSFLDAAERSDFQACWQSLTGPLRERYTPARLGEDFHAVEGRAREKLARARAAMASPMRVEGSSALLSISEHRTVRLVLEGEAWKIAALE
jgi:hypothetical protein